MSFDPKFFPLSREALYEMVWMEPSYFVAKRLGVSDTYLKRKCVAMGVPKPGLGYWAKVASGQVLEKPELPILTPRFKATWVRDKPNPGVSRNRVFVGKEQGGSLVSCTPFAEERQKKTVETEKNVFDSAKVGEQREEVLRLVGSWSETREVVEFLAAARHGAGVLSTKQAKRVFDVVALIEEKLNLLSPAQVLLEWAERTKVSSMKFGE